MSANESSAQNIEIWQSNDRHVCKSQVFFGFIEAVPIYTLKSIPLNMHSGQGKKHRELVRPAGLYSKPV